MRAALFLALLLTLAHLVNGSVVGSRTNGIEKVHFATNLPPDHARMRPVTVRATLYLPSDAAAPYSAVIIAPSSGGVREVREIYYARALSQAGIAALVLDSFGSRGLKQSIYDQSLLEEWDIENDAVAGLRWMLADGRFHPERIGILGVSKGGTVAMNTALAVRRGWMGPSDTGFGFAAHVAISPDCVWINRSAVSTNVPVLFLLAELDDQTPPEPCIAQADRMRNAGNPHVAVKIYEGAHHAWEAPS